VTSILPNTVAPSGKRRWHQWKRLVTLLLATVCIIAYAWLASRIEVPKHKVQSPVEPSGWPREVRDVLDDAWQRHVEVKGVVVYWVVGKPEDYCPEYLWQATYSPELLSLMTARWELASVGRDQALARRSVRQIVYEGILVSDADDVAFFGSPNWIAGEKGAQYLVMHNRSKRLVIIHYFYNF